MPARKRDPIRKSNSSSSCRSSSRYKSRFPPIRSIPILVIHASGITPAPPVPLQFYFIMLAHRHLQRDRLRVSPNSRFPPSRVIHAGATASAKRDTGRVPTNSNFPSSKLQIDTSRLPPILVQPHAATPVSARDTTRVPFNPSCLPWEFMPARQLQLEKTIRASDSSSSWRASPCRRYNLRFPPFRVRLQYQLFFIMPAHRLLHEIRSSTIRVQLAPARENDSRFPPIAFPSDSILARKFLRGSTSRFPPIPIPIPHAGRHAPPPARHSIRSPLQFVFPSNSCSSCWRTSTSTKSHLRSSAIRVQLAPARDTIRISLQIAFTPDFILARQFLHETPSFAFLCNCNPSSPSPCWRTRSNSR